MKFLIKFHASVYAINKIIILLNTFCQVNIIRSHAIII